MQVRVCLLENVLGLKLTLQLLGAIVVCTLNSALLGENVMSQSYSQLWLVLPLFLLV